MSQKRALDAAITQAREGLLRKRVRAALRGLTARDRDEIQSRVERIVREINAHGGNKIGIQGDLRREELIELWDTVLFAVPMMGISLETGKIAIQ